MAFREITRCALRWRQRISQFCSWTCCPMALLSLHSSPTVEHISMRARCCLPRIFWVVASGCHVHALSPHWLNIKGSTNLGELCRFFPPFCLVATAASNHRYQPIVGMIREPFGRWNAQNLMCSSTSVPDAYHVHKHSGPTSLSFSRFSSWNYQALGVQFFQVILSQNHPPPKNGWFIVYN
jgi:hypothetical protein